MEENRKEVYIETRIDRNSMFSFMLNHSYRSVMGVVGVFISIMAFIGLIVYWRDFNTTYKGMLIIVSLLFTVINPATLYLKSKKQVKLNDSFHHPLCYNLNDDGIDISQAEQSAHVNWEEVIKIISTKKLVVIYLSPVRAFIFPKEQIGDQFDAFKHMIADHVQCRKVIIK